MSEVGPNPGEGIVIPLFPEVSNDVVVDKAKQLAAEKPWLRPGVIKALLHSIDRSNAEILDMLSDMARTDKGIEPPDLIGED